MIELNIKELEDYSHCKECRVLRKINEEDKIYWEKEREKYYQRSGRGMIF